MQSGYSLGDRWAAQLDQLSNPRGVVARNANRATATSLNTTREPSFGRAFFFSKASATALRDGKVFEAWEIADIAALRAQVTD